jgi:hypothetical protein
LVISPSPGAFRNRGSPQLARAVTAEISQNINSPRTGPKMAMTASLPSLETTELDFAYLDMKNGVRWVALRENHLVL